MEIEQIPYPFHQSRFTPLRWGCFLGNFGLGRITFAQLSSSSEPSLYWRECRPKPRAAAARWIVPSVCRSRLWVFWPELHRVGSTRAPLEHNYGGLAQNREPIPTLMNRSHARRLCGACSQCSQTLHPS